MKAFTVKDRIRYKKTLCCQGSFILKVGAVQNGNKSGPMEKYELNIKFEMNSLLPGKWSKCSRHGGDVIFKSILNKLKSNSFKSIYA